MVKGIAKHKEDGELENKIKPCVVPECGKEATGLIPNHNNTEWFIFCKECHEGIGRGTKKAVIKAWNRRTNE